ncbi:hypothetical protein CSHISOI_03040 [Colletotrichum shisoi]|uniref:Uncharacterized protein n=1 Tax=Colletotrichum shisoi TaxID=2078593 RepID=A0A5Q4BZA4_9PEZI|nr:hypothetical protein CSHISOI_03040 [Colletotrichum shisoi]
MGVAPVKQSRDPGPRPPCEEVAAHLALPFSPTSC